MNAYDPDEPPDDPDLLAAEYVIGLLTSDEMREVEAEAIGSPTLAASILGWQARLHPMTEAVPPVPPPVEVWQRLEATLGFVRSLKQPPQRSWWRWGSAPAWRGALVGAVCTVIVGGAVLGPKLWTSLPGIAVLVSSDQAEPAYQLMLTRDGFATIVAVNPDFPENGSLQLWTLDGATPVSLGLLPRKGRFRIEKRLVPGAKLLISREPKGGSPDAVPSGPVIYQGSLIRG